MGEHDNLIFIEIDHRGNVLTTNRQFKKAIALVNNKPCTNVFDVLVLADITKLKRLIRDKEKWGKVLSVDLHMKGISGERLYVAGSLEVGRDIASIRVVDLSKYSVVNEDKEQMNNLYYKLASTEEEIEKRLNELILKQKELEKSEERYSVVVETASMGIWEVDYENNTYFASPKVKEIIGYEHRVEERDWLKDIHPEDKTRVNKLNQQARDQMIDRYEVECRIRHPKEGYRWTYIISKWIRNSDGNIIRIAGSITNIDEKKKAEERVRYMAYVDQLTGLRNKNYLHAQYNHVDSGNMAAICIDITNFKVINDSFGYSSGDTTIREIANRLKDLELKECVIARLGTAEFGVIIEKYETMEKIYRVIEEIEKLFLEPLTLHDMRYEVNMKIGVALGENEVITFEELLRNADIAMHRAKKEEKSKVLIFKQEFKEKILDRIRTESNLRQALENDEFILYYQPQVNIEKNQIQGFEALIRWVKESGEMIPPSRFIPIAEESRLIIPIGEWVIRQACQMINQLKVQGHEDLYIGVNVSSVQLTDDKFVEVIDTILKETQVNPNNLHIEITETILMESIQENIDKINALC